MLRSRRFRFHATAVAFAVVLLKGHHPVAAVALGSIGIDFVGLATSMAASETAGAVPRARWNSATGTNRSVPMPLFDENGTATPATATWSSDSLAATAVTNVAGNNRLMKGYIEARDGRAAQVSVAGLTSGAYDVYVYVDGNNGYASRSTAYQVTGVATVVSATDAPNVTFAGTFVQAANSAGNYVRFRVNGTGFTLTGTPMTSSIGAARAPINGIQVVPVAAPSYRVSGVISPPAAGVGVTVRLGGTATAETVTNASGAYSFPSVPAGNYAVMPTRSGYTVTPSSRSISVTNADVANVDFQAAAMPPSYAIGGLVQPSAGGAGTTLVLSGASNAVTTANTSGAYSFGGLASGTYVVTPAKAGFAFVPAGTTVVVGTNSVSNVNFFSLGPTKTRANSYDDGWERVWVDHGRALLNTPGKTPGFVLHIGDSITFSRAYSAWARSGDGRTTEDLDIVNWTRVGNWSAAPNDATSTNGWYLAGADTTSRRSMTAAGGMSVTEYVLGCCNVGPTMPVTTSSAAARQLVAAATYTGNLQISTVASAFSSAQFAVVMLGTNDPGNPNALSDLALTLDALEAARILPILSTIPPRNDAFANQFNVDFNAGVRALARSRALPLVDFYQEMVLRRPGTTWITTLIDTDGVHPTGDRAGFTVAGNPYAFGGDPASHTTGDAVANVGYLLRSWLTVQKLKEVKRYVIDGVNPP